MFTRKKEIQKILVDLPNESINPLKMYQLDFYKIEFCQIRF